MPPLIKLLIYVSISIISMYATDSLLKTLMPVKKTINIFKYLLLSGYVIIATLTYFTNFNPFINITIHIGLVFLLAVIYIGSLKYKLIITILYTLFKTIVEGLVGFLHTVIMKQSFEDIAINEISFLIGVIAINTVILLCVKFFQVYNIKKNQDDNVSIVDSLQVITIPICSIFIMYFLNEISTTNSSKVQLYVGISILILVFMNLFFYFIFDRLKNAEDMKRENALLTTKYNYYVKQQRDFKVGYDKIMTLKHDLKHQMLNMKSTLNENTENSLKNLHEQIDKIIGDVDFASFKQYTDNEVVNTILNYKLSTAIEKKIKLDVKVTLNKGAKLKENNISVILGNAIDNAIENFYYTKQELDRIEVKIFEDNSNLYIKISNPFSGVINKKNNIILTTKENPSEHGMGLSSIKNIIEKNDGYINIDTAGNIFTIEVIIFGGIK